MTMKYYVAIFFLMLSSMAHALKERKASDHPKTSSTNVLIATFDSDRKAAISYTFDDGLQDQYTLAYPEMRKRGIRATFAIIGSKVGGSMKATNCPKVPVMTWDQLRQLHADGFEIASHGWAHRALPKQSEEGMRYDVATNDSVIEHEIGQRPLTYVYPGNAKTDSIVAWIESTRVGSRTKQISFGGGKDLRKMNTYVDDLINKGSWGVTMTHGIAVGYDHFNDPTQLYRHWDYVVTKKDLIWVAPFGEVAAYVKERDSTKVITISEDDRYIELRLESPLNPSLFRQPLTLLADVIADEAWQDGKPLEIVQRNDHTLIKEVNPAGGSVTIRKSRVALAPKR